MKYIRLIRHAKSAEAQAGESDHDRRLAARGERDGPLMQDWLAGQAHPVEWVWASTAERALSTAEYVAAATTAPITSEVALYAASPDTIIDVIRSTPPDIESVAVVAHNPGLTYAANFLAAEPVTDNLVTFGVALFGFENEWATLVPGYCHFMSLHTPKTIARTD